MSTPVPKSDEIQRLERLYRQAPDSRAFAPLADAYRRAGHLEEAIQLLRRGVALYPNYVSALVLLALCYRDVSREDEAEQIFARVFEQDPGNLLAMKYRAERSAQRGAHGQAVNILERILEIDPYDFEARQRIDALRRPAAQSEPQEPQALPTAPVPPARPEPPPPSPPPAPAASTPPVQNGAGIQPPEIHLDRVAPDSSWNVPFAATTGDLSPPAEPAAEQQLGEEGAKPEAEGKEPQWDVSRQDDRIVVTPAPRRGPIRSVEEKVWGRSPQPEGEAPRTPEPEPQPPAAPWSFSEPPGGADETAKTHDSDKNGQDDHPDQDEFATLTVARIYESQGYLQQALTIYEELHEKHPGHAEVTERLRTLQARLSGTGDAFASTAGTTPSAADTGPKVPPATQVAGPDAPEAPQWRLVDSASLRREASQTARQVREVAQQVREDQAREDQAREDRLQKEQHGAAHPAVEQRPEVDAVRGAVDDLLTDDAIGSSEGESDVDFERFLRYVRSLKR